MAAVCFLVGVLGRVTPTFSQGLDPRPSGSITGSVLDSQGSPPYSLPVKATRTDGTSSAETMTDAQGRYTIANLTPGTYAVHIRAAGYGYVEQWFNAKASAAEVS